jgi:hypothetical protein
MQADRPERMIEHGRDSSHDQSTSIETGVKPIAHLA